MLDNLKYHAWKQGGNSVLLIKKQRIQSGQSSYTDTCGYTTIDTQYSNKWTGIIAQVPDSIYNSHAPMSDTVNYVKIYSQNAANTKPHPGNKLLASTVVFSLGILGLLSMLEID